LDYICEELRNPHGNKKSHFTQAQEAARKDVERAFGVLQSRFTMIRGPTRFWGQRYAMVHIDSMCDLAQYDN
jgi:hypothetical protein